ncbi:MULTISPECIES: aldehyde dehydrogenase (NADP(+)) [unclassified Nocardioides]|uniref:aldehyde dehydrogenase (NADP(+)) n=1 Tax=unclassified Nocardioides TaxID=2615069 RepID=UPI0000571138|nr:MULTISPECIES: aldehyde dehydrogenase (NADP(+)) [unclassified Nocardioides]ABL79632.1 aldehyde dehydrogenase [Nocardioides sp. JS614]
MDGSETPDDRQPPATVELMARAAADAFPAWSATPPRQRASALSAVADAVATAGPELIATAMSETGLPEARLTGELNRTVVQIRLFADIVVDGAYLDVRIDEADDDFVLDSRPDLRRYHVPVGPVLNFAASNFPFAFSVIGGDTVSALAAGCPVVVKAHPGHLELSRQTAAVVRAALTGSGAPDATLQLLVGQEQGVAMLLDPRIRAASFTGSTRAGRMLADLALGRPAPIPFYGELGSVNPAFVTSEAAAQHGAAIAQGFLTSVCGSAGQLCTKPGFLFVPRGSGVTADVAQAAGAVVEQRLLNPSITAGYTARRDAILGTPGVRALAVGDVRVDGDGQGWATPTLVATDVATLHHHRESLLDEAFGPLSVVVEYDDEAGLPGVADELFEGNLTSTIHAGDGEDTPTLRALVDWAARTTGRIVFGGWPTGVSVTHATQHGGPWPATTNDAGTSVGSAAIGRFLRAVAYQDTPQALLPAPLRDDNPWGVPQLRSPAGRSRSWGEAFRVDG